MTDEIIRDFPVTVYGNLEKYNDVISKGRCRIFYKGANRNGTFISDEFAEKLIKSLPYTPVKGIYDDESKDFTDHGERRNLGRIYGVVPAEPNFAWENHLDDDGVEREYACVDVLYYTGLYGEAREIAGKSQSMELYAKSIKGDWKILNGKRYYVYEDACFLGLQALGDSTEPCFEGAAFYSLFESMKEFFNQIKAYNQIANPDGQGEQIMEGLYRLSDDQKYRALWELLNSEVDENGYAIINYSICEVYDDYAIAFNYRDQQYERVYYKKNDETDSVEITERIKCYVLDVTESEYAALKALRAMNGETYDKVDERYTAINSRVEELDSQISALETEKSELNTKNVELEAQCATLNVEKDNLTESLATLNTDYAAAQSKIEEIQGELATAKTEIESLTNDKTELLAYRKNVEDNAKLAIIDSYSDVLSEEVLNRYKENLDSYTDADLDMRLTYEQKQANPNMFSSHTPPIIPKNTVNNRGGIESILDRYENK